MAGGNNNNLSIASLTPTSTFTVFINSNLDTYLAVVLSPEDTVADLKSKVRSLHPLCFPNIGEITVHAVKVKREAWFYHLPDPVLVKGAFDRMEGTWFLHMDASPACSISNQPTENIQGLEIGKQLQDPHLLFLEAETNDLQAPKDREVLEAPNLGPKDQNPEFGKCSDITKMSLTWPENHGLACDAGCVLGEHVGLKNNTVIDQDGNNVSYKENGIGCGKDDKGNAPLVLTKTDEAMERTRDSLSQIDEQLAEILKPVAVGRKRRKKKKEKQDDDMESMKEVLPVDPLEAKNEKEVVTSEMLFDKPLLSDNSPAGVVASKKKRKSNYLDELEPMVSFGTTQRRSSLVTDDTEHVQKSVLETENHILSPGERGNQENNQNALEEDYDDAGKPSNPETTLEKMVHNKALDSVKKAIDGESVDADKIFTSSVERKIDALKQEMHSRGKEVRMLKNTQAVSTELLAPPLVEEPTKGTRRVTRSSYKHISCGSDAEKLEIVVSEAGKPKIRVVEEPSSLSPLLNSSKEAAKNDRSGIDSLQLTQSLGVTEAVDSAGKKRKKSMKIRHASAVENDGADKEETQLSKAGKPKLMAMSETNSSIQLLNSLNKVAENYPLQLTQDGVTEAVSTSNKKRKKSKKIRPATAVENDDNREGKTALSLSGKPKTMALAETNSLGPLLNSSEATKNNISVIKKLELIQNGVSMALDTAEKKRINSRTTRPATTVDDGDTEKGETVLLQDGKLKLMPVEETSSQLPLLKSSNNVINNSKSGIDPLHLTQSEVAEAVDNAERKRKKSVKTRPATTIENDDTEGEETALLRVGQLKQMALSETNSPSFLLSPLIDTEKNITDQLHISKEEAYYSSDNKINSLQVKQSSRTGEAVGVAYKKVKRKSKNSRATTTKSPTEPLSKLPDEHSTFGDGKNLEGQRNDENSNSKNQLLGSMAGVEKDSRIEIKHLQKKFSNGFESNVESGSPEVNAGDGYLDKVNHDETHKFERDVIDFIEYFSPGVKQRNFVDPEEKFGAKEIEKEKNNKKRLQKLGHKELETSLKENGAARPACSSSTECSEGSLYKSKPDKQLPSGDCYWVSVRKPSAVNSGEIWKNSNKKKSLLSDSDPIFDNISAESSEGEGDENESEATSQSLSDNSSASAYSDGPQEKTPSKSLGLEDFQPPGNGPFQSAAQGEKSKENIGNNIGQAKYKDSSAKSIRLSQLLKGSTGYKKAHQKASQSRLEETESQPVDIVFDTQPSQPESYSLAETPIK